jgi:hypothetical protein
MKGYMSERSSEEFHLPVHNTVQSAVGQPIFLKNISHPSSGSNCKPRKKLTWSRQKTNFLTRYSSETSVSFQRTTWHILQDWTLRNYPCDNLKSYRKVFLFRMLLLFCDNSQRLDWQSDGLTWNYGDGIGYFKVCNRENRHSLCLMTTEALKCETSNLKNTIYILNLFCLEKLCGNLYFILNKIT